MALTLAACGDKSPAEVDAPEPASLAEMGGMTQLPEAPPAPVGDYAPAAAYPLAERAYGLQRAVYDAPPDYGFDYDGVAPMVWETEDDWAMYAEPWEGDYRYYYYEPGAERPYFVRDREYGYGYSPTGQLIAVFDSRGRYLERDVAQRVAPLAGRYYLRGGNLREAGRRAQRTPVSEPLWYERAPVVERTAAPWLRAAREETGWRAWREADRDRELARFEPEQRARTVQADRWRERRTAIRAADDAAPPVVLEPQDGRADRRDDRRDGRREDADDRQRAQAQAQAQRSPEQRQVREARGQAPEKAQDQPKAPTQKAQAQPQRRPTAAEREKTAADRAQLRAQQNAKIVQGRAADKAARDAAARERARPKAEERERRVGAEEKRG